MIQQSSQRACSRLIPRADQQRGVALLAVLLVLVVVTSLLVQLQQQTRQDLALMEIQALQQQGWGYLLGAEALGRQVLTDGRLREQPRWWATLRGEPLAYPVDEGLLSLQVKDLRTCMNLNHLAGITSDAASADLPELLPWRLYLEQLRQQEAWQLDWSPEVFLDRVRDWVDADSQVLEWGAETGQYLMAEPARVAANQPLADLSELNLIWPASRERLAQLPASLCQLPSNALRLNVNNLAEADLFLLWSVMEGQVSWVELQSWWSERPDVGYTSLDDFWTALNTAAAQDPQWKSRVSGRLMLVSDFYRLQIEMQLHDIDLVFEADLYLSPQAETRIYARRWGPVDGRQSLVDQVVE
ncbi:type II secretion system minor pseudopilin GspK [Marinospirillum sp.]|uniref:type II secretion system minor pseudopilin GspK n=1 Tax=Marinospirillum sp. TaxID=2183934 RepID=UPI003A8A3712